MLAPSRSPSRTVVRSIRSTIRTLVDVVGGVERELLPALIARERTSTTSATVIRGSSPVD